MAEKVWSAAELDDLSASQVDDLFRRSLVTNVDGLPPRLIEIARRDIDARIGKSDTPAQK